MFTTTSGVRSGSVVLAAIAAACLAHGQAALAATTFTFKNVKYNYTISGVTYDGKISGSFVYDNGVNGGIFANLTNLQATSSPYVNDSNQTSQSIGPALYSGGRVLPQSGTTQTVLMWGGPQIGGVGSGIYEYGVSLTFAQPLQQLNGEAAIISFTSTGNDNFCNKVDSGSISNFCTSQKNNINGINGTLNTPSPVIGLGLVPMAGLAWRRWQRRRQRDLASVAG